MSEHVYFATIILPLAAILIIFAMKYWASIVQAHAKQANDDAYRALAEKSAAAQQECSLALAEIRDGIAKLSRSQAEVEAVLKQVG